MSVSRLLVSTGCLAAAAVGIVVACDLSYGIRATPSSVAFGPTGQTYEVDVALSGASAGTTVTFGAVPSSLTLSATSAVTDDNGQVTTYVLVPYGVTGVVSASAPYSRAGETTLVAEPLVLCPPQLMPGSGGPDIGSAGEVYSVSVQALIGMPCPDDAGTETGAWAPPGVPIVVTTAQPSTSGSSGGASASSSGASAGDGSSSSPSSSTPSGSTSGTTMLTNAQGLATTNLVVPWGPNLLVQATGGGAVTSASLPGIANPASISCLSWATTSNSGVYQLTASVLGLGQAVPAASVAFSVVYPWADAGSLTPTPALTNDAGVATTFLAVPDASPLPLVVEAVVGSSATTRSVGVGSGNCP